MRRVTYGITCRTIDRQHKPGELRQGHRSQKASLVHARRAGHLPVADVRAAAGHRPAGAGPTLPDHARRRARPEIGRASCRARVGPYVKISVVAVSLKKKKRKK